MLNDLHVLTEVLDDLDRQDYEQALMEISEIDGYNTREALIAFGEYDEARNQINRAIDAIENEAQGYDCHL